MSKKRLWVVLAVGIMAGLILGSVSSGFAATTGTTPAQAAVACGLGLGGAVRDAGGRLADVVAKLTGQTPEQVTAARASGKTFAQIAGDKGVSASAVVDQALKVRKDVLDAKVKSGAITQAQEDAALDRMNTRLTQRVSDPTACTGTGSGRRGGGGMGGGCGAGAGGGGCGGGGSCATQ